MSTQRCIWIFIAECLHYNYKMKTIQLLIELRTCFICIQWNATQHYKWMKYWCMLLHGCYMKESTLNILGWLNGSLKIFYNTLEKNPNETFGPPQYMEYPVTANPWDRHQICSCLCLGMGKKTICKGYKWTFEGKGNVLKLSMVTESSKIFYGDSCTTNTLTKNNCHTFPIDKFNG